MNAPTNDHVQYQMRTDTYTNRELLLDAPNDIAKSDHEKQILKKYKQIASLYENERSVLFSIQHENSINQLSNNEAKKHQFAIKFLQEHVDRYDQELKHIEKEDVLKPLLQKARQWADEKERRESAEILRAWREKNTPKPIELKQAPQKPSVKTNYTHIDYALSKERRLQEECIQKCGEFRREAKNDLKFVLRLIIIGWYIAFVILLAILSIKEYRFSVTIIAIIITTPLTLFLMYNTCKNFVDEIGTFEAKQNTDTYKEIIKVYIDLLNGINLYDFLGIPLSVKFDSHNLPYDEPKSEDRPYGSFTVYGAISYRQCYHLKQGCSGMNFPRHKYEVVSSLPCRRCAKDDTNILPDWYVYYKKINDILNRYPHLLKLVKVEPISQ